MPNLNLPLCNLNPQLPNLLTAAMEEKNMSVLLHPITYQNLFL